MVKSFDERYGHLKSGKKMQNEVSKLDDKKNEPKPQKKEKKVLNSLEALAEVQIEETDEVKTSKPKDKKQDKPKGQRKQPRRRTMADDNKLNVAGNDDLKNKQQECTSKLSEKAKDGSTFKEYLENNGGYDITTIKGCESLLATYKKWEEANKSNDGNDNQNDRQSQNPNEDTGKGKDDEKNNNLEISQGKAPDNNEPENTDDKSWIDEKVASWNKWCTEEHDPKYQEIVRDEEAEGLKFDVYKTPEDKEAGKRAATIHYTNPRKVSLETEDGKAPDLEFFDKLVREAKETDKVPGVTFNGEMTPEFQARLAAACIKNGLSMKNGPQHIDVNLLDNMDEDLKKKIETYNKKQEYKNFYEQTLNKVKEKYGDTKEGKPVQDIQLKEETKDQNISQEQRALVYAALVACGHKVSGMEGLNAETEGMIAVKDLTLMPEEAQKTISQYNTQRIEDITKECQEELKNGTLKDDKGRIVLGKQEKDKKQTPLHDALLFAEAKKEMVPNVQLWNDLPLPIQNYPNEAREVLKDYNQELRNRQLARINKRREQLGKKPENKEAMDERKAVEEARARMSAAREKGETIDKESADYKLVETYRQKVAADNKAKGINGLIGAKKLQDKLYDNKR